MEEEEPDEEGNDEDPEGEESLKRRSGHEYPEPAGALPSSISPRLRDILASSRGRVWRQGYGRLRSAILPAVTCFAGRPVWRSNFGAYGGRD